MNDNALRTELPPETGLQETLVGSPSSCAKALSTLTMIAAVFGFGILISIAHAGEPAKSATTRVDLGGGVTLEVVYISPGEFMMGSTPEEKKWATGVEGGATPGTTRESFEGERPRLTRVKNGFWMGRTEVSVGQFHRFVEESGFVSDAEKPGGWTQCFDPNWDGYHLTTGIVHPWKRMAGKSWRDPNWGFPNRDVFPVVCVSYNDMKAFCRWLTERERKAGRLTEGLEYRLPTEAEWEYACRGGSKESHYFWWGNELEEGEGRLNISAMDFLPGRTKAWPRIPTNHWSPDRIQETLPDFSAEVCPASTSAPPPARSFTLSDRQANLLTPVLTQDAGRYRWVAATPGLINAARLQLACRAPVMGVGGFNKTDPFPQPQAFRRYVAEGAIHYWFDGGPWEDRPRPTCAQEIERWVRQGFEARYVDGFRLFDLTRPKPVSGIRKPPSPGSPP